jgi:hypothetical protein
VEQKGLAQYDNSAAATRLILALVNGGTRPNGGFQRELAMLLDKYQRNVTLQ